jgi:hypothetical protein
MGTLPNLLGVVAILISCTVTLAQQPSKIPPEAVDVLRYLEGTWEFEGRVGTEKISGTFSARWAPGRYALITHDSTTVKDSTTRGVGVLGWDTAKKRIGHFGFIEDNNAFLNHWTVATSGDWVGQLSGTREGKDFSAEFKLTKKSPDQFVVESKEPDGKEVEIVYKKMPRENKGKGGKKTDGR